MNTKLISILIFFVISFSSISYTHAETLPLSDGLKNDIPNNFVKSQENTKASNAVSIDLSENIGMSSGDEKPSDHYSEKYAGYVIRMHKQIDLFDNVTIIIPPADQDFISLAKVNFDNVAMMERITNNNKIRFDGKSIITNEILWTDQNKDDVFTTLYLTELGNQIQNAGKHYSNILSSWENLSVDQITNFVSTIDNPNSYLKITNSFENDISNGFHSVSVQYPTLLVFLIPISGFLLLTSEKEKIQFANKKQILSSFFIILLLSSSTVTPFSIAGYYINPAFAEEESNKTKSENSTLANANNTGLNNNTIMQLNATNSDHEHKRNHMFAYLPQNGTSSTNATNSDHEHKRNHMFAYLPQNGTSSTNATNSDHEHKRNHMFAYLPQNGTSSTNATNSDHEHKRNHMFAYLPQNGTSSTNATNSDHEHKRNHMFAYLPQNGTSSTNATNSTIVISKAISNSSKSVVLLESMLMGDFISVKSFHIVPNATQSWQFNSMPKNSTIIGNYEITKDSNVTSLKLDGRGYLKEKNASTRTISNFTISAWVKPDYSQGSPQFTVISKENAFVLAVNNNIPPLKKAVFSIFDGIKWNTIESNNTIPEEWTHLAVTYNSTSIGIYVNGTLESTSNLSGIPTFLVNGQLVNKTVENLTSNSGIIIGAYGNSVHKSTSNLFSGSLQGITLYPSAFNATQISRLYHDNQLSHSNPLAVPLLNSTNPAVPNTNTTSILDSIKITDTVSIYRNSNLVNLDANGTHAITNYLSLHHDVIEIGKPITWIQNVTMSHQTDKVAIELPADAQILQINSTNGKNVTSIFNEEKSVLPPLKPSANDVEVYDKKVDMSSDKLMIVQNPDMSQIRSTNVTSQSIVLDNQSETLASLDQVSDMIQKNKPTKLLFINDTANKYGVKFETPAPYTLEKDLSTPELYAKNVTIAHNSTLYYTDVKSYSSIPEDLVVKHIPFKLYWMINGSKVDVTNDPRFAVEFVDTNANGIADQMQWIVPKLSAQQQFVIEAQITIINLNTDTIVGNNWQVRFNTTGTADLTITPVNGTTWSNSTENNDLKFLSLACGNQDVPYEWVGGSVFIPNFKCDTTAIETSTVLKAGHPRLMFSFGEDVKFANDPTTSWYNSNWLYRKSITIQYTKVSSAQSNFPVLISTTQTDLKNYARSDGHDILFTDSSGSTKLNHEIENYTSSTGKLVAWVQVPTLSSTANTVIYMYYGNPSSSNQQNIPGTWDSNYVGVWHLNSTSSPSRDSTSHANSGTWFNAPSPVSNAQIGTGLSFTQASNQNATISSTFGLGTASVTMSAWVYLPSTSLHGAFVKIGGTSPNQGYAMGVGSTDFDTAGNLFVLLYEGNRWLPTTTSLGSNAWHYVTMVIDASSFPIGYVDGVNVYQPGTGTAPLAPQSSLTSIGGYISSTATQRHVTATIDEVEISNTARSAGWIATQYNNQNSPSTFYTIGSGLNDSESLSFSATVSTTASIHKSLYDSVTLAATASTIKGRSSSLYDSVTLATTVSTTSSIKKSLYDSVTLADTASTTSSLKKSLYDSVTLADSASTASSLNKSLYDSVTLSDTVQARPTTKQLYDSVTLADTASTTSSINKSLDDSMALADSASTTASINKSLDDSMALADTASTTASINTSLYDSVTLDDTASTSASINKSLDDSMALADSASTTASINKSLDDSMTLADSASTTASINKSLDDSMTLVDSASTTASINTSLYDSVTLDDTASTSASINKSLDDSMALADSASTTSSINKSLYDSMALADSYSSAKSFRKSLYDSVTLADSTSAAASLNKPLYDSVTLDDTASTSASINKSLDDSMALADSASTTASINKSLYDSMALADSYSSAKSFRKSLYDSVTLADSTSAAASLNKPLYDSVTLADSASTTSSINKSLDDSMALADSASTTSSINKSLYDSMALADSYSSAKSFRKSLYDSVTLADSTSAAASLNKPLYDSVTLADSASTTSSINKSLDDSMALADSASTTSSINKSLDDSMALADSTSTSASINKSLYDSMALADSYSSAKSFRKSLYDSVTLADSASAAASLNKPLYDSVTLDDTASTSASINKSLYDSMALADSYSSAKSFRKSLYDSVTLADTASTLVNKSLYDSMTLSDTVQARPTTKQLYDSMTLADSVSALKPSLSSLTFDPTSGPVGSTITISGTNFIGNTLVTITLPDGSTTTVTTFATGSFTKIVTMPSAPGVAHTIPATDGTNTASFPFKITPTITVSPSSGSVGDTVTLSGTGYAANSLVTITLPDGNTTTVTTDSKGSFTKIITMPSAPAGINPISGTDGTNTASSSFTINAKTTVSPSSGNVGDTVTISETGFKANSLVTITLPDGSTITGTTNATGSLTKIITIPSSTGGAHTISGTDGTNTAGSSFTINAKTTVSPTSGAPGSSATVSGTGYKANSLVTITLPDGSTTTATTDSKGSFTKIITIPISTTTGLHTIHATDGTNTASSSFVASLATITLTPPASGPVGSTVTVSGSNFRANQAITIKYGGSTVTTIPSPVTTNGAGSFSGVTFAAPSTSAAGHNNVTATDTINQASANFTATGVAQSLTPSPSSGSVGDTVTLSGTGFAWGDTVTITLPDGNTTTATTDSKGSFTKQVIMPSAPAGINPISATDQHSNTASSSFTINAKTTVSPSSGSVGDTVTISETGFKANSLVTITLPDGSTITGTTDATGSLTKIITMPSSTGGAHTISGTDGTNTAGSSFTINAKTTISPTSGGVGSLATLSGTGYKANSLVTITLPDGNTVTATTDSTGSFTKIITIPSTISGDHTISTTDGTNHASSTFTIVTAPPQPTLKISYATGTQVTPSIGPTWNSAGNGGSAITNYTLYRSLPDQPGTELLLTTVSSSTTSYTDSSVRTGHMYYYQVTAWNAIGESVKSTEAGGEVFDISSTNNVTATDPILSIHITPTTTSAKINYQTSGNVTLSHPLQITANNTYGNYAVSIPAGITISGSGWNGILSMPLPLPTTSVTAPSGTTVDSVISLGFSGATLTFDKPVEIVFSGDAGKRVGFSSNGGPLTEITTACLSDTSSAIPGGSHECKINSGSDLHVWTLHFTSYSIFSSAGGGGAVTSSVTSGGGAGGVGMGPSTGPSTSVGNFTGVQESNLKILDVSYDTCTTNMVKILVAYSDNSPSVILRTSITGVVSATPAQVQPFEIENQNATIQRLVYEAPINNKEQTFEVLDFTSRRRQYQFSRPDHRDNGLPRRNII